MEEIKEKNRKIEGNNIQDIRISKKIVSLNKSWGITKVNLSKFTYTWTILNFSFCGFKLGDVIESPVFSTVIDDTEFKWILCSFPYGRDETTAGNVTLHLKLLSDNKISAKVEFIIENYNYKRSTQICSFSKGSSFGKRTSLERKFIMDKIINKVYDDKLTVHCNISTYSKYINISGQCQLATKNELTYGLFNDLELLLKNEKFSDVKIKVNEKEFKVHKAILAARSSVFAAMFECNMIEAANSLIEIPDIDYKVVEEMLRFIYTNQVQNIEALASDLLFASDKYNIEGLKILCENFMCQNLSIENVLDYLRLADLFAATNLKSYAVLFVASHASNIINKVEFEFFKTTYPHLITEILDALTKMK